MGAQINEKLFFNHNALNVDDQESLPESQRSNPDNFFKDIAMFVDLEELYEIVDTCYQDTSMPFCPVILKMIPQKMVSQFEGKPYLLQVWDMNKNKKLEISFNESIKIWSINSYFLTFISKEEDQEYLELINADTKEKKRISNFKFDDLSEIKYVSYNQKFIIVASSYKIKLLKVDQYDLTDDNSIVEVNAENIHTIAVEFEIHGLLIENDEKIVVAFETADNQLDYNLLYWEDEDQYIHEWHQMREVPSRNYTNVSKDPFSQILRQKQFPLKGKDDSYVQNKEDSYDKLVTKVGIANLNIGIDKIVKVVQGFLQGVHQAITMRSSGKIDIYTDFIRRQSPDNILCEDINIVDGRFYFKVKGQDLKFEVFSFYTKDLKDVSFGLAKKVTDIDFKWDKLIIKKVQNIVNLYRGIQMGRYQNETACYVPHNRFLSVYSLAKKQWVCHFFFEYEIFKIFRVSANYYSQQEDVLLINGDCYISPGSENSEIETINKDSEFFLFNIPGTVLRCCEDLESFQALYLTVRTEDNDYQLWQIYRNKSQRLLEKVGGGEDFNAISMQYRNSTYIVVQNQKSITLYLQDYYCDLNKIREYDYVGQIRGILHSGTFNDPDDHLILFDEENMYVIKDKPYSIKVYPEVYCIGLQNFQNNYNYILCQERNGNKNYGLRYFDMQQVLKEKFNNTLLKRIDIGTCGVFEWTVIVLRICFIESLKNIVICPILHRNQHKFLNYADQISLICRKIIKDRYITLQTNGVLQTHCVVTAKILSEVTIPFVLEYNKSLVEIISKTNQGQFIVKEDDIDSGLKVEQYFESWQLKESMKNQKTFNQLQLDQFKMSKFTLFEIKNEREVEARFSFYFPSSANGSEETRIYFNTSCDKMLTIKNEKIYIYSQIPWKSLKEETKSEATVLEKIQQNVIKIQWILKSVISDYLLDFGDACNEQLTLMSLDFSKYITLSKKERQFKIKDVVTGDQYLVPKHLMNYQKDEEPVHVLNRFKFLDPDNFVITSKNGIEKKILIDNINKDLVEVSYNKRPLFNEIEGEEWRYHKYYFERGTLSCNQSILERLQRRYQDYKSDYFLHGKRDKVSFYETLLNSDTHFNEMNQLSFTFVHWSLIDQMRKGELLVEELDDSVIKQILYNILPGGNTVLHVLCNQPDQLMKLVQRAHPTEDNILYHIPFLPNFKGVSPLHLMVENKDFTSISFILNILKYYEIDHHSRAIQGCFKDFIEEDILEFHEYLEARYLQTDQLKNLNRGCLKELNDGLVAKEIEFSVDKLKSEIMKSGGVESRIKCEFLDVGGIYHLKDKDFDSFFDALGKTSNIQIFGIRAIQNLIEFNYDKVREYVFKKLFIPFCFYHLIYLIFTFVICERYMEDQSELNLGLFYGFSAALILFSFHELSNEMTQLNYEGWKYFKSFWNYVDLFPPLGICTVIVMIALIGQDKSDIQESDARIVLSIITVFMWLKLLYFLRIFENTSYLIRMIVEVVIDMKYFFLVILITIVAFGNAMLTLSLGNHEDEEGNSLQFTSGYVDSVIFAYRMVIGDFDTEAFGEVARPLVVILFLLCTIFNMIIMLNLLIAIISETFNRVTANSVYATYQERASIIGESNYLVPVDQMIAYAPKNKILLVIKDLERIVDQRKDPIIAKVEVTHEEVMGKIKELTDQDAFTKLNDKLDVLTTKNETNSDQIQEVKRILNSMTKKKETVKISIYEKPLEKYFVHEIAKEKNDSYFDWECAGKKLEKCKKTEEEYHTDLEETVFYCKECQSFNLCSACFYGLPSAHQHGLEEISFEKLKLKYPDQYSDGWQCSAMEFEGCRGNDDYPRKDMDEIFYKDNDADYYLCGDCVSHYKI